MINIVLCGKSNDASISEALLPVLARYGGVQYFNGKQLAKLGDGEPDYFVYECEQIPKIEIDRGVLLFKNSFQISEGSTVPENIFCIFETQNKNAAAVLKNTHTTAITCGTSQKDTISIAGLEETGAVLSLQRNIKKLDGEILEPHDFTVQLSAKIGPHRILAVSAVLMIIGVDSSVGYKI